MLVRSFNKGVIMSSPNSNLPNLNNRIEEFILNLEKEDLLPLYEMTPQNARGFFEEIQRKFHKNIEAEIEDKVLLTSNTGAVSVRVVRPKGNYEKLPVIIYAHGGGWIIGSKETHDMLVRTISNKVKAVVVFVEYSLAPEYQFPTQLEQIYAVCKYVYNNSEEFNVDKDKMIIAGDSAGANMAIVVAIKANEDKDDVESPKFIFQCLFYPVTNFDMDTKSYDDFKNGPWLSKKAMQWFCESYAPEKTLWETYYVSPIKATEDVLNGLPPALIITDENDVLRDEGEAYARKLDMAGVEVTCCRINGTIHDFLVLNSLYDTFQTQCAIDLACSAMKFALE